ncbi:inositol-3-phosphate synthase [Ignavibacterium sp.]|jgi:myo-inositol-1-phosphate synthase|uniref:inositol-3-phosphate synthase n=1 Tax=Ignavibacterium sp. TaxID=2651167 RepID=UPI0025BE4191|nr:inositol-3-phosphate synthase [Ignavibacterium sp.]
MESNIIEKPDGKLGVLIVGLNGAISTTFLAGIYAIKKGLAKPIGSLTQMGTIRIGKRSDNNFPLIKDFVPLASLDDLVFGGWDIRDETCYEAAKYAKVLNDTDLNNAAEELKSLKPMKGVFDQNYVKRLTGTYVKEGKTKYDLMMKIRDDIKSFKELHSLHRVVVIWAASTETFIPVSAVHQTKDAFIEGMKKNDPDITPSMLYAYAAVAEGAPYINGSPSLSVDAPAIVDFANEMGVPVAGKDFKTGQTLVKTVIAPMLKARLLGLSGWFSTNILGNRDGEVLDDPGSFKTKEESKLSVIDSILQPDLYPDLYDNYYHKVRINYYPPRGDNKEGWDNIDIFGWLGYPMQLKINFLCRDSILAAPIVLDLILFADLAKRSNMKGIQEWMSLFFKSPMHSPDVVPEHDLFIQMMKLKNTLRRLMNESPITHLDTNGVEHRIEELECYD